MRVTIPEQVTVYSFGPPPPGWKVTPIRGADGKFARPRLQRRVASRRTRYADFTVLGTPFESGTAVWPVPPDLRGRRREAVDRAAREAGRGERRDRPLRPGPGGGRRRSSSRGPCRPPRASGGGSGDDDSDAAIWLGVIAIGIAALAVLAIGFLWSTRPATLPADEEDGDV